MWWVLNIFLLSHAWAQAPQATSKFDVASVKLSVPSSSKGVQYAVRGGPGTTDPSLAILENIDLFSLTAMAYSLQRFQLSAPEWVSNQRFDISARIPPGATAAEYRAMLQILLAERFHLAVHRETREQPVYELAIAKGGPKLEEAADQSPVAESGVQPPPRPSQLPPGYAGAARVNFVKIDMAHFAAYLSGQLGHGVIDATGLEGNYVIHLHHLTGGLSAGNLPESAEGEPTLMQALQEQAGLRLVSKKALREILVIDHAEKEPVEN